MEALYKHLTHLTVKFAEMVQNCNEAKKLCLDTAALIDIHDNRLKVVEDLLESVMLRVEDQNDTISMLNQTAAHSSSLAAPMRIKVKESEPFDGTRDDKLLGNFCWDVEKYLDQMNGCSEETKVNVASMFLKGTVKLWWRTRAEDLASGRNVTRIET